MHSRIDSSPVALVGFGGSGSGIHAPLIASNARLELAVIVTKDADRRRQAAGRFPEALVTDALEAAGRCAVAVVALPVAYRGDTVERLLDRGLRVVVEKPFAADLMAAQELAALAEARLTVFHNRRWDSDFLTLRRLRSEGAWSGPIRLTSRIQRWQPSLRDGWRNRSDGGGFLREVGTHQIDQVLDLLGPATRVYAEVSSRRPGAETEDDVFIAAHHADGSISHIVSGALGDPRLPRFDLASTETLIRIGSGDPQQEQLVGGMSPAHADWGVPDTSEWWMQRGSEPAEPVVAERGWWPGFYDAVADWAGGGAVPVPAAAGVATMAVIEAARASAERAEPVWLDGR